MSTSKKTLDKLQRWCIKAFEPNRYLTCDTLEEQEISQAVEEIRIPTSQIIEYSPGKTHKAYANKYFIPRMTKLARDFKDADSYRRQEILERCYYNWNIYLAAKISKVPQPAVDVRDLMAAAVKDCLKGIKEHEVYWDIRMLSMHCRPELFQAGPTHVELPGILTNSKYPSSLDLQEILEPIDMLNLKTTDVTLDRLILLKKGLLKLYPEPQNWPIVLFPDPEYRQRFARSLLMAFCRQMELEDPDWRPRFTIPPDRILDIIKACIEFSAGTIPTVVQLNAAPRTVVQRRRHGEIIA
ncbi:hypothetical protein EG329_012381 [Mollisiaceae sp. DMI_Dod_QoI]|nr:hypothetical protein EG329_012381 [Helotiales sp. DMI_Dod_QoI]